jgi:hypothetical protein
LNREIIYHGHCDCLDNRTDDVSSNSCTKRYLLVNNFFEGKTHYIAFCNTSFRLKYQQKFIEQKEDVRWYRDKYDLLKDIIFDNTKMYSDDKYFFQKMGFTTNIRVEICSRPFLRADLDVFDAIDLFNKNNMDYRLKMIIKESFYEWIEHNTSYCLKYAKYKSHHKKAEQIKRKAKNFFTFDMQDLISDVTEFATDVIIKYKPI